MIIEESQEETLLGVTFNKRLNWKAHLEKLKPQLHQRIAILKRLSFKLPQDAVTAMIEPIFCAKVRYVLELTVDTLQTQEENAFLKAIHTLHRSAMKSALGLNARAHPSDDFLYKRTKQISVHQMAEETTAYLAWKCGQDWDSHPLTAGKIKGHCSGRNTRQSTKRSLPPQLTGGTLISRLVEMWEILPEEVKSVHEPDRAKHLIKNWCSKRVT